MTFVPEEHYRNREQFPEAELAKYFGKEVAWSLDGKRIVASGDEPLQVCAAVMQAGLSSDEVVLAYVPFPDEIINEDIGKGEGLVMIKAIVKNGVIVPCEPLPEDWQEGTEVEVEKSPTDTQSGIHPTDAWMDEVEAIAAQGDPADDLRLEAAIQEIRRREHKKRI